MTILPSLPSLRKNFAAHYSPWLIIGLALILAIAVAIFSVHNAQRERAYMSQNLMDRANTLIWAMEAGTRAGMSMRDGMRNTQALIEETAKQPGVMYIAVTDTEGILVSASDKEKIGEQLYPHQAILSLHIGEDSQWRSVTRPEKQKVFEVYKKFSPLPGFQRHMWHNSQWGAPDDCSRGGQNGASAGTPAESGGGLLIFIGLDLEPFEQALAEDLRNTILTGIIVGLLALGGVVSLFWAQNYSLSRRLLQDTKAFASEVVAGMPGGLVTTDENGLITLANTAAAKLFDKKAGQLEGHILDDGVGISWSSIRQRIRAGQLVHEEEHKLILPKRESIPISVTASQIINEENVHLGFLFLLEDTREKKRLREQLRRSERLSTLGNMAARVAHEIRNPLSSIKGFARYFFDKMPTGGGKEIAATMMEEVDRLNRVVTELLDFSRPSPLTMEKGDINEVIKRALRLTADDAQKKGITATFHAVPGLPHFPMDFERLTQVFLNLFLNAIQAMEQGGDLTVGVRAADDSKVMVTVTDTGGGMCQDVLERIFTPYYTTKTSGTGLGLAIVLKILEEHGSDIIVDSTQEQGSTFTLIFPQTLPWTVSS